MTGEFESSRPPLTSARSNGDSTDQRAITKSLPDPHLDGFEGLADLAAAMVATIAVIAVAILLATVDVPLAVTRLLLVFMALMSVAALFFALRGEAQ